jgi:hypothetical protein
LSTRSIFSASMPAKQSVGCQPIIRRLMYEYFVVYLSFLVKEVALLIYAGLQRVPFILDLL